jgi:ABC-type transport system involved in multi-copper enzyme maturation permease subunit
MIRALLWKEYRVNRVVVIFAALALLGPYAVMIIRNVYIEWRYGPAGWWSTTWFMVASMSLLLSFFTAAMLGGNAVAGERADRSAEFLATLPPSRAMHITIKAIVAAGVLLVVCLLNLFVVYVIAPRAPQPPAGWAIDQNTSREMAVLIVSLTVAFGASWFVSCLASSHALAGAAGIGAPVLVGGVIYAIGTFLEITEDQFAAAYYATCISIGVAGFVGGIIYYLRRVEP